MCVDISMNIFMKSVKVCAIVDVSLSAIVGLCAYVCLHTVLCEMYT